MLLRAEPVQDPFFPLRDPYRKVCLPLTYIIGSDQILRRRAAVAILSLQKIHGQADRADSRQIPPGEISSRQGTEHLVKRPLQTVFLPASLKAGKCGNDPLFPESICRVFRHFR